MKRNYWFTKAAATVLAVAMAAGMTVVPAMASSAELQSQSKETSLIVATDRHENWSEFDTKYSEKDNNLEEVLTGIKNTGTVNPSAILISGDNTGRSGKNPIGDVPYYLSDIQEEVDNVYGAGNVTAYYTYGSHDKHCLAEGGTATPVYKTDEEGQPTTEVDYYEGDFSYDGFLTGPQEMDGYYLYGISFSQMGYADNEQAEAGIQETLDGDYGYMGDYALELDKDDPNGDCAEEAVAEFLEWVESLDDNKPIVVGSHIPAHYNRNDNLGGGIWAKALNKAAETHDVILIWGHNHTCEEQYYSGKTGSSFNLNDQVYYLKTPGDTVEFPTGEKKIVYEDDGVTPKTTKNGSIQYDYPSEEIEINFTYMNAGYLKLGYASAITFIDNEGDGTYDELAVSRYSIHLGTCKDADGNIIDFVDFGTTEYSTPYRSALQFATDNSSSTETEVIEATVKSVKNDAGCKKVDGKLYYGYTVEFQGSDIVVYSEGNDGLKINGKLTEEGEDYTLVLDADDIVVNGKPAEDTFTDVTGSTNKNAEDYQYFRMAVDWAVTNKIANGYTAADTTKYFGVGLDCERQDFVLFLYRLAGTPAVDASKADVFTDVASSKLSSTFKKAIAWAVEEGIVQGFQVAEDGTRSFGVGKAITRKDAVIMLYRYADKPAVTATATGFTDVDDIYSTTSDTFKAIVWAKAKNITNGLSAAQCEEAGLEAPAFGATLNCTREQMITFIFRFVYRLGIVR